MIIKEYNRYIYTYRTIKEHNLNWPQISHHLCRISIVRGFGSEKTNALCNKILTSHILIKLMYILKVVCIFWKYIHYTIHWDKAQFEKFPLDKINGTKKQLVQKTSTWSQFYLTSRFVSLKLCLAFSIFDFVSFL